MLKVSPVAEYLRSNSGKAKFLTEKHYFGDRVLTWIEKSNFVNKNNGDVIGNITHVGQWRGGVSASHKVIVKLPNVTEIRSQKVQLAKIIDGSTDKFVPEKVTTEIKTIEKGKEPVVQKIERFISSKLFHIGKDTENDVEIYNALEPIKYSKKL